MSTLRELAHRPMVRLVLVIGVVAFVGGLIGGQFSNGTEGGIFVFVFVAVVSSAVVAYLSCRR